MEAGSASWPAGIRSDLGTTIPLADPAVAFGEGRQRDLLPLPVPGTSAPLPSSRSLARPVRQRLARRSAKNQAVSDTVRALNWCWCPGSEHGGSVSASQSDSLAYVRECIDLIGGPDSEVTPPRQPLKSCWAPRLCTAAPARSQPIMKDRPCPSRTRLVRYPCFRRSQKKIGLCLVGLSIHFLFRIRF